MMKIIYVVAVIIFGAIAWYHLKDRSIIAPVTKSDSLQNNTIGKEIIQADDNGENDTVKLILPNDAPPLRDTLPGQIATGNTTPEELVSYAESLLGIPYLYGSTDPQKGFDCSGFITYVFNHFQIKVPRSSIDFTNVGKEINESEAKRGDIILFTGTDSTEKFVGHMGIIVSNQNNELQFIHSTSGKSYAVTTTIFNAYYKKRFVKVIRIFRQLSPP